MQSRLILPILFFSIFVSGCAMQPTEFEETPKEKIVLPYARVLVEDFTKDRRVPSSEAIWANGWFSMFDGSRGSSFNKALYNYLKEVFIPGAKYDDTLRITLVDSDFLMQVSVVDSMAFVNILAGLGERGFKCTASVSVSNKEKAERKEFEVYETGPGTIDSDFLQAFVYRCRGKLVDGINAYLQNF